MMMDNAFLAMFRIAQIVVVKQYVKPVMVKINMS